MRHRDVLLRHRVVLLRHRVVLLRHREILSSSSSGLEVTGTIQIVVAVCICFCDGFLSSHVPGALQAMAVLITHFLYSTALDYRE